MNKEINYKAAGTFYFIANIFNKGIAFLTVPIFTRLLSTYDYGIVTTYNAWASILSAILGMSLNTVIRCSYGKSNSFGKNKSREMSSVFTFTILYSIMLLIVFCAAATLSSLDFNITLIVLCFFQGLFSALIIDYSTYQMMEYKYIGRTLILILPNLLSTVVSVPLIMFLHNNLYMGRVIPLSLMHCLVGIVVCFAVYKKCRPCLEFGYLKKAIIVSAPLIIHSVALNLLSQADRTMITALRNASETGIYSLVYNFSMIATVVTTSLEGIWVPWFTDKMNLKSYKEINKTSIDYINLMTYAMSCLILVSVEILKLLASKEYWGGISIIPPIVISNFIIFIYTLYVNIEYYYEKYIFITINTFVAAIVNIGLNFIFIPKYGYIAAAYTTLVSYMVSFFLHARYVRKINKKLFSIKSFIRPIIHLSISTTIFYIFVNCVVIRWCLMIVYLLIMLTKERKRLGFYFPKLAEKSGFFR